MKKKVVFVVSVFFFLLFIPVLISAQRGGRSRNEVLEVRLASPMPRNSDWGRTLEHIAAEWRRVTNNEVILRVIHDGIQGGEAKMLSSLSANDIQAALFTSFGLITICPAVMTLSVPFLIEDEAELDLVLADTLPVLENQINQTNYAVVTWSKGGWVNVFSKEPVLTPNDLRGHKIASNPDSEKMNTAFRSMRFNMVETEITDVGPKLASGMISAIYQTPAAVAPLGLHKTLKNMLDKPIAPFLGAIIINRVTWNKISPERQQELRRVTQQIAREFDSKMPKLVNTAVSVMSVDGLKVNQPDTEQERMWRDEMRRAIAPLLGPVFDESLFRQINVILEKSRGGQ